MDLIDTLISGKDLGCLKYKLILILINTVLTPCIKHEVECFIRFPNAGKWDEKVRYHKLSISNFEIG